MRKDQPRLQSYEVQQRKKNITLKCIKKVKNMRETIYLHNKR